MDELVTFKGNREGLTVVLDIEADFQAVLKRLAERLTEAGGFLDESAVSVDVGPRDLQEQELKLLNKLLAANKLYLRRVFAGPGLNCEESAPYVQEVGRVGQGVAKAQPACRTRTKKKRGKSAVRPQEQDPGHVEAETKGSEGEGGQNPEQEKDDIPVIRYRAPLSPRDDIISAEQTILVQRTVRSGQKVFYPGNVVVLGDVNPGGEIVAGGNIIIVGTCRGIAHAGALGEEKAVVAALRLEPSQLRIASHITRAPDGEFSLPKHPEIARVQDGIVIIEQYQPGSDRYSERKS